MEELAIYLDGFAATFHAWLVMLGAFFLYMVFFGRR